MLHVAQSRDAAKRSSSPETVHAPQMLGTGKVAPEPYCAYGSSLRDCIWIFYSGSTR